MARLDRFRRGIDAVTAERARLGLAAAALGIGSGAAVAGFRALVDFLRDVAYADVVPSLSRWGAWTSALVPVAGGLLAGLLVAFVIGRERHHGVAGIIEAVALDGGRLRWRRAPAKAVGAAIAIGSGASVGPEDPSVQIGANLGSFLGAKLRLGDDRVRMLVAAGAAGGIAAAFGAPIAGVFFALEVVLGDLAGVGVGLVLVTAVLAAVTARGILGEAPALAVPRYEFRSGWEVPLHLGLGALLGPVSALYVRTIDGARGWFERSPRPRWTHPVLAGAAVGVVALWLPQVRGVDYDTIESTLRGVEVAAGFLLLLAAAKIALTGLCIGAGFPGGVFAPALFVGCLLGGAYGMGAAHLFPGLGLRSGAFAMAGMAGFLAAAVHAPLTSVLLVFEITSDYGTVGAAMAAVAASMLTARWIEPESVYSRPLARRGFRRRALAGIETERTLVDRGAACAGRRVREVPWPEGCVVARIRRGTETITPRGDTVIEAGDEVVAVADGAARSAFVDLCRRRTA